MNSLALSRRILEKCRTPLRKKSKIWQHLAGQGWPVFQVQKGVGRPLVHRNSLLKLLGKSLSHNNWSVCVSLKEIRIQRHSSNTEHNLSSGFSWSIGTVKESLNQLYLSLCLILIEAHFFLSCLQIAFAAGLPNGEPTTGQNLLHIAESNTYFSRICRTGSWNPEQS